jgi:hypothetical protein
MVNRLPGWLLATLLACGCGQVIPAPELRSLTPAQMVANEGAEVTFEVDAVLPTYVDHATGEARIDREIEVRIGAVVIGRASPSNGAVTLRVPTIFIPGTYDAIVTLADGRSDALEGAFTVTPGSWPTGYSIAAVGTQTAGVPFDIEITAQGPAGATFGGNVLLSTNKGAVTPNQSGAFSAGTRTERIVLAGPDSGVILRVEDVNGGQGQSSPFTVNP